MADTARNIKPFNPMDFDEKAGELVAQMTLEEKAGLCSGNSFWTLKPIDRLDIPEIMVTDGPHGLRKQASDAQDHAGIGSSVPATCFPTAVTLASSWDRDLMHDVGITLGRESLANQVSVLLGPGINIKRHPLCGRNFEYISEDPYLAGELSAAYINGVQSQGVGTSLKHYAANNQEESRLVIDTIVDERTLREIYLPAFETAVKKSQPATIMCAYNRLNGVFCSEHDWLLNKVLRDEWGFEGLVVTDWGAANIREDGIAAGLDLEMPASGGINDARIVQAVNQGTLDEAKVDLAARRITRMILASQAAYDAGFTFDQDAHHEKAKQALIQSAVLLKNDSKTLPLAPQGKIAVIGAFAETPRFQGAGSSQVNPTRLDKPLDAIRAAVSDVGKVSYAAGYDPNSRDTDQALIKEAVGIAKDADQVILFAGLPGVYEMEGDDRPDMALPQQHLQLIYALIAANPNITLVMMNGSPVEMPFVESIPAVLEVYLPGQAGADAIADLLFGKANPSGKLAETFPIAQADSASDPHFPGVPKQVTYREGLNVGYRWFDKDNKPVLFPFGHGLSYTNFTLSDAQLSASNIASGDEVTVSVTVTNTGDRAGAEVVQVYVRDVEASVYRPEKELKGFAKTHLAAGESRTVSIALDARAFAFWDIKAHDWVVEPGDFEILVGTSSRDIAASLALTVTGDPVDVFSYSPADPANMSDDDMAALGQSVPTPDPIRPFHITSTLGDIQQVWLGRKVVEIAKERAKAILGETDDPVTQHMADAFLRNTPLRVLPMMSQGAIKPDMITALIHALNGKYLKAFAAFRAAQKKT